MMNKKSMKSSAVVLTMTLALFFAAKVQASIPTYYCPLDPFYSTPQTSPENVARLALYAVHCSNQPNSEAQNKNMQDLFKGLWASHSQPEVQQEALKGLETLSRLSPTMRLLEIDPVGPPNESTPLALNTGGVTAETHSYHVSIADVSPGTFIRIGCQGALENPTKCAIEAVMAR